MDVSWEVVKEKLLEVLPTVDLETTTTRDIFRLLAEDLGHPAVKAFRAAIRVSHLHCVVRECGRRKR